MIGGRDLELAITITADGRLAIRQIRELDRAVDDAGVLIPSASGHGFGLTWTFYEEGRINNQRRGHLLYVRVDD